MLAAGCVPNETWTAAVLPMRAAADCITDATLACLRANIDDTDAATAAMALQQHALSMLTGEVLAVRADVQAYAHELERKLKLALEQDRRSVPMRSARAELLASCGALAPSPIRDVEALQASLDQQRAAILQLDAATKNIVERATETLADLRQIEHLGKVLAHARATDPARMLDGDATDQLLRCCEASNENAMVPPPLRDELLLLLCERAARDAAPTLPTNRLAALVALLGRQPHSVPEALVVRVLLANVLMAGAAEQREAILQLVKLQGASWEAAAAALCPRVVHLGMSDGLPGPAREELLELLARRAPLGSALSLAIARTRLSSLYLRLRWYSICAADDDAHFASTISFAFRTAAAASESRHGRGMDVEATVGMVLQLENCSVAQVRGPGWGAQPPSGTTGSAESVRAAASSFVAAFVARLGGRLGLIFTAARRELARHPAQRLRLLEHLDGVGEKLADALLAQVGASAQDTLTLTLALTLTLTLTRWTRAHRTAPCSVACSRATPAAAAPPRSGRRRARSARRRPGASSGSLHGCRPSRRRWAAPRAACACSQVTLTLTLTPALTPTPIGRAP